MTINCPSGSEDEYALTGVKFSDKSKAFANNTYASSIDYYYTPATASYSKKLAQTGGWWSDLVDNNPPSGSIDGNYATSVTVHWVSGISYVNASCTTMTQMTLDYLVPFGIIAVSYTHLDVYKRQAYIEEQKTRGKDEIPENLTEKMYGAITSFKEKYTMIQPNREQLLMSIKI